MIYFHCYISFPLQLLQPIKLLSPARMVLLLVHLLLLLDLGQTQALVKPGRGQLSQEMMLGDQDLNNNSLTDEDEAMTLSYLLPPAWGLGALFRGRKPDTGEPISHFNVRPYESPIEMIQGQAQFPWDLVGTWARPRPWPSLSEDNPPSVKR